MARWRNSKLWHALHHKKRLDEELWIPGEYPRKTNPSTAKLPTELLQEIFSYLDIWTLLRIRFVCRIWSHCIPGTSPTLRTTMFLLHAPVSEEPDQTPAISNSADRLVLNFTMRLHGPFTRNRTRTRVPKPQRATSYTITSHGGLLLTASHTNDGLINPFLNFNFTYPQLNHYLSTAPTPLWLKTQIFHPPLQHMTLRLDFPDTTLVLEECIVRRHETECVVRNAEGITVGDVLIAMRDAAWWPDVVLREEASGGCGFVRILPSKKEGDRWLDENEDGEMGDFP